MKRNKGKQLLVIGIGNEAMADDGLGVAIVEELSTRRLPEGVQLTILGPDPLDLLLLDTHADGLVIIDALIGAGRVGTLHTLCIDDIIGSGASSPPSSLHQVGLPETLRLIKALGMGEDMPVVFLGVECEALRPGMELSAELAGTFSLIVDSVAAEIIHLYERAQEELHTISRRR